MTSGRKAEFEIVADAEAMAHRVADWLSTLALAREDVFAIALSGGNTPRLLYRHLAAEPYLDAFPWSRAHWFWGDERFVPHGNAASNYRMVQEAMLSRAPIPAANVHAIPTEGVSLHGAASLYEAELKSFYGAERLDPTRPLFDVTLLGLGPDGHTASLFPGTAVLAERVRWVAAVADDRHGVRITLTYPALESSRHVAFLVAGTDKHAILARYRRGDASLPASHLAPRGALYVFADRAAAGEAA
jgi:6-phosphogluconolactonase